MTLLLSAGIEMSIVRYLVFLEKSKIISRIFSESTALYPYSNDLLVTSEGIKGVFNSLLRGGAYCTTE